jgi:serine phosphatase RsbU (regulator of sigma subunit)
VNNAELRFAKAGHPSALHIWQASPPVENLQGNGQVGPAMGSLPSADYGTAARSMSKGDLILLFTDGLFEVEDRDGNVFSQQQFYATVNRHVGLPARKILQSCAQ